MGHDLGDLSGRGRARLKDVVREKNIVVGVLAVPATRRAEGRGRSRRRGRPDHLQLLGGAARRSRRRDRAHVEPGSRPPPRSLLPPHVTGRRARLALARLSARRDGLERLHPRARARMEQSGPRGDCRLPGARSGAVRPRRRAGHRSGPAAAAAAGVRARPLRGARASAAAGPDGGASGARTSPRTPEAVRGCCPPISSSPTTCCSAGRSASAAGVPFRVKAHGSELEYSMRGRPELEHWGRETLAAADATFVGSEHIRERARGRRRPRRPRAHGAAGRRRRRVHASRIARRGAR